MRRLEHIQQEAVRLARYALDVPPSDRLVSAYSDVLREHRFPGPIDRLDRALLASVKLGPWAIRMADSYARIFRPGSELRRRLILLIALAEVHGEDAIVFKEPLTGGPIPFFFQVGLRASATVLCFLVAIALFGPAHLWTRMERWRR